MLGIHFSSSFRFNFLYNGNYLIVIFGYSPYSSFLTTHGNIIIRIQLHEINKLLAIYILGFKIFSHNSRGLVFKCTNKFILQPTGNQHLVQFAMTPICRLHLLTKVQSAPGLKHDFRTHNA